MIEVAFPFLSTIRPKKGVMKMFPKGRRPGIKPARVGLTLYF